MISCLHTKKIKKKKKEYEKTAQKHNGRCARLLARDHKYKKKNKKKEYEKTAQKHNGRRARLFARDHNKF
jgi:hypothetical protein